MTPTVLIVGGGIAGAAIGAQLAPSHDVHLLEAEAALAVHTTGRSAAVFSREYGSSICRELTQLSTPLFAQLEHDLAPHKLFTPLGALLTGWDDVGEQLMQQALEHSVGAFEQVTAQQAAALCPVLDTSQLRRAAYEPGASRIDVMALHAHYVAQVRLAGGQVHRDATVTRLHKRAGGWSADSTDGRRWEADLVINAAGAWGDQVLACADLSPVGLRPLRRSVAIARPSSPLTPASPIVVDVADRWYFKPESGAVLLSPQDESLHEPGDPRPDHEALALAIDEINAVSSLGLRHVTSTWAGLRTFSPDGAPIIGPHPDEPTLHLLLGLGGFGIQTAPAVAAFSAAALGGPVPDPALRLALQPGRFGSERSITVA